jgi:hypothetical protein
MKPKLANQSPPLDSVPLHPIVRCSCGSQMFVRTTAVRGVWREWVVYDDDGTENHEKSESTTDGIIYGAQPKTITCANCGKRRPNPSAPNGKLCEPQSGKDSV